MSSERALQLPAFMRSWASLPDATVNWKNYCNSEFEKLLQQLETGSRQQSQ
jgi:hypothetical protein